MLGGLRPAANKSSAVSRRLSRLATRHHGSSEARLLPTCKVGTSCRARFRVLRWSPGAWEVPFRKARNAGPAVGLQMPAASRLEGLGLLAAQQLAELGAKTRGAQNWRPKQSLPTLRGSFSSG